MKDPAKELAKKARNFVIKSMLIAFWRGTFKFVGFVGCMLAMNISWTLHEDILWAIVHSAMSWLYVFWLTGNNLMLAIVLATIITEIYVFYRTLRERWIKDRIISIVHPTNSLDLDFKAEREELRNEQADKRKDEGD